MQSSELVCREQRIRLGCGERFIRSWNAPETVPDSKSCSIVLGLIHGLGDHSGRFDEMARWFAGHSLHVHAVDLLGHGNSPGPRMAIRDYETLLLEVESFLGYLSQQHPDSAIGLYGQSMGGNLVLNHQLRGHSQPTFVIAGSPMLRAVNQPGAAQMLLVRVLSRLYPQYRLGGELDPSDLSRDPQMQRAFQEDPLVQRGITARMARVLIDSGEWAIQSAHQISTPTLIAHGSDDRITCHHASLKFAEKSFGKATTTIWPGGKHDLHHDTVRDEYFASLLKWITDVLGFTRPERGQTSQSGRPEPDESLLSRESTAELTYRPADFSEKSTTSEIAKRFDEDVERFSNLETGQSATIDAPLSMQLITEAAVRLTPTIERVLDLGCGAGNNTLKLHQVYGKPFQSDLLDLSGPMLERAEQRVREAGIDSVTVWQADLRDADLPTESYDVVLAAAVLHHLRDDADWKAAFEKVYSLLRPGGSFWITDLVVQETVPIYELMWSRYGDYLEGIRGAEYRQKVFDYIEREDSPRPVTYQLDLLRRVGFQHVELLHKNSCFAAFGAWKG